MAENYDISPSSRPKQVQSTSKKTPCESSGGPLSYLRIKIAVIVAAVLIGLALVVYLSGAFGGPVKNQDLPAQLRREKALRDREESPHDTPTQPAQPVSGQSSTAVTD